MTANYPDRFTARLSDRVYTSADIPALKKVHSLEAEMLSRPRGQSRS